MFICLCVQSTSAQSYVHGIANAHVGLLALVIISEIRSPVALPTDSGVDDGLHGHVAKAHQPLEALV